jgi:hypothetical protein
VGPFNDNDTPEGQYVLETNVVQLTDVLHAIKIHVKQAYSSRVFVDQGKARACDVKTFGHVKSFGNTLGQACLPASQLPIEGDNIATYQLSAQKSSQTQCLFSTRCNYVVLSRSQGSTCLRVFKRPNGFKKLIFQKYYGNGVKTVVGKA